MKKLFSGISLAMAGLILCGTLQAQDEIDQAAEHVEEMAAEIEVIAEEIGEKIEAWAEENSEELEQWAEKYSKQWENWAESFEGKMERWAADQEGVWEDWAEKYSSKWEDWADKLESNSLSGEDMSALVEKNLEMLSEMPLGDMVDGLLENGVGELKDAPWESLADLQHLFEDSIETSLRELEGMAEEGSDAREALERGGDEMGQALGKMQKALDLKLKALEGDAEKRLSHLKELLKDSDLSDEQKASAKEMARSIKKSAARKAAEAREEAKIAREKALKMMRDARKKKSRARDRSDRDLDEFNEELKSKAAKAMKETKKKAEAKESKRKNELIEMFLQEAEKKRDSVKSKESELDVLRKEIESLRDEIRRLKKDK